MLLFLNVINFVKFIENMRTDDPNKFGSNQIVNILLWFFIKSWKYLKQSKSIGIEILAVQIVLLPLPLL